MAAETFHCTYVSSFFARVKRVPFQPLFKNDFSERLVFSKAGFHFSERLVFRKESFQKGWFSEMKFFRKGWFSASIFADLQGSGIRSRAAIKQINRSQQLNESRKRG
jgi:hypothetical protein